ncbi:hypothetical protein [Leeuwenhoekiella sp. NPDC079379]|uniref:hypothetical protein n=1 Tax=Leeuwenhoekiella sp. NPDC079379 TaxID=3364122 RepID=UPI0037CC0043
METTITIAIYIHALFGAIGLIAGTLSFVVKKGSKLHKKAGNWFAIGMLVSSGISLPVACMPDHKNQFLFLIGLFTIYMVIVGKRALRFKSIKVEVSKVDWLITGLMILISLFMIFYGSLAYASVVFLYVYFGVVGLIVCFTDVRFLRNPRKTKTAWLVQHIGKIMGAYIASVTAFLVAGLGIPGLAVWVLPSVVGTFSIVYWIRKTKKKKVFTLKTN